MTGEELTEMVEREPAAAAAWIMGNMLQMEGHLVRFAGVKGLEMLGIALRHALLIPAAPVIAILFVREARKMAGFDRERLKGDLKEFCSFDFYETTED